MLGAILKSRIRVVSAVIVTMLLVAAVAAGGISLFGTGQALAAEDENFTFRFVTVSTAGIDPDGVHHEIGMNGDGQINGSEGGVEGGGSFVHYNNDPTLPTPKPLIATGTWEVEDLISFTLTDSPDNPFGRYASGILEAKVRLFPDDGPEEGVPARLKVVCNLGFAGVSTGLPEGVFLKIPEVDRFEPATFPETEFPFGLTIFVVAED
jgi:hypothetical protein